MRVIKPARRRLAISRERVLRGAGATRAAKRRQRVHGLRDRASKSECGGGRRRCFGGRQHLWRRKGLAPGPAGVGERSTCTGGPPGTWETRSSPSANTAKGEPGAAESPGPGSRALRGPRERKEARRRYRQAKETKRGGTGDLESELLTVPVKRGNLPRGTPWRERAAGSQNHWRER